MKVVIKLPSPWRESTSTSGSVWSHPEVGITLEVSALVPTPEDRKAWGEAVALAGLPAGGSAQQLDIVDSKTVSGWPMTVASLLHREANGQPVEFRVATFVEILYFGASAVCRVTKKDIAAWESTYRAMLLEAVRQMDVDFSGGVRYLSELYESRSPAPAAATVGDRN